MIPAARPIFTPTSKVGEVDTRRTGTADLGFVLPPDTGVTRNARRSCQTLRPADRGPVFERVTTGDAPVFLLSLEAGSVGLTLTAAGTVLLYDPRWNPAVERQAMNRAHRTGQDKPVFVHRLVAKGTVEDKILPFLNTYRTMCVSPEPEFRQVLEEIRWLDLAA